MIGKHIILKTIKEKQENNQTIKIKTNTEEITLDDTDKISINNNFLVIKDSYDDTISAILNINKITYIK